MTACLEKACCALPGGGSVDCRIFSDSDTLKSRTSGESRLERKLEKRTAISNWGVVVGLLKVL